MKYLSLLILFLIIFVSTSAFAQRNKDDDWYKGEITLEDGTVLAGDISYYSDHKTGMLQIDLGKKILSYDANQLISFNYFDTPAGVRRTFYSLPYKRSDQNYKIMLFFEVVYDGPHLSLLSKVVLKNETRTANNAYYGRRYRIPSWYDYPYAPATFNVLVPYETLYLVNPESEIEDFSDATALVGNRVKYKKSDQDLLFSMMGDKKRLILSYIEENKLDVREKIDLIKVIAYYNNLKQKELSSSN